MFGSAKQVAIRERGAGLTELMAQLRPIGRQVIESSQDEETKQP
jgi:hypothetical protein